MKILKSFLKILYTIIEFVFLSFGALGVKCFYLDEHATLRSLSLFFTAFFVALYVYNAAKEEQAEVEENNEERNIVAVNKILKVTGFVFIIDGINCFFSMQKLCGRNL